MLTSSVILDIAILGILALSVLLGARRGLFRSLAELVSYIAAYAVTTLLAGGIAAAAADWVRPLAEERIRAIVSDYLAGLLEEVPAFLTDLTGGGDLLVQALPEAIVDQGLYNLAYALVFAALFLAVLLALRLLIRAVDAVLKLPLLHEVNTLGGIAAGAAKGLLIVFALLLLARRTGLLISAGAMEGSRLLPLLRRLLPL